MRFLLTNVEKIEYLFPVLALTVVSAGVAVATVADSEFNLFGAIIAVVWIIPSAINKILWSTLQQQGQLDSLGVSTCSYYYYSICP
ncbi:hypothetical protein RIF29_27583 [Crotalaria pallida]|uniref:Sugar phosphate transporter domain-containing protein n=1 Tax=Crotalaria pallida TaxID=3830 RepID=A0AAN9EQA3_CROPI